MVDLVRAAAARCAICHVEIVTFGSGAGPRGNIY
jgi:hypothetical protein